MCMYAPILYLCHAKLVSPLRFSSREIPQLNIIIQMVHIMHLACVWDLNQFNNVVIASLEYKVCQQN